MADMVGNNFYENNIAQHGLQVNGHAGGSGKHSYHNQQSNGENSRQANGDLGKNATMQDLNNFMKIM